MTDKDLNLFDDCAEYVHLCPQEEDCTSSSWGHSKIYAPGILANSQTQGARVISNEIPVLFGILC